MRRFCSSHPQDRTNESGQLLEVKWIFPRAKINKKILQEGTSQGEGRGHREEQNMPPMHENETATVTHITLCANLKNNFKKEKRGG